MTRSMLLLIAASVAVGLPRVLGVHGEAFQAVAHLYVGGLIGAWLARDWRGWRGRETWRSPLFLAVVALSALEVGCFLYFGPQSAARGVSP